MASLIKDMNKAVRMNYMAHKPLPCTDPQSSSYNEDLYITRILLCNSSYGKEVSLVANLWQILKHKDRFLYKAKCIKRVQVFDMLQVTYSCDVGFVLSHLIFCILGGWI